MSEFDKIDVCVNCKIKDFCSQYPDNQYTCEDIMEMAGVLDHQKAMKKKGYFPVACRLCGEITWFPMEAYKKSEFERGYECHKHSGLLEDQLLRF